MDRTTALDFVERLRAKPEHVRRRIALGTTVGVTGVVAFGWMLALIFSGSLSIAPTQNKNTTATLAAGTVVPSQGQTAVAQPQNGFSQLLGAVGVTSAKTQPSSLMILDTPTSTPTANTGGQSPNGGNQTIIPF